MLILNIDRYAGRAQGLASIRLAAVYAEQCWYCVEDALPSRATLASEAAAFATKRVVRYATGEES